MKNNKQLIFWSIAIFATVLLIMYFDKVKGAAQSAASKAGLNITPIINLGGGDEKPVTPGNNISEPLRRNRELSISLLQTYSPEVKQLQTWMNEMGASPALETDGYFGAKTRAALMAITHVYLGNGKMRQSTTLYEFQSKIYNVFKAAKAKEK